MKKLLLGTVALAALGVPAIAADMGVRPAARYVAATNWTGCHVGGLVGNEWGRDRGYTTTAASTVVFVGPTAATPIVATPLAAGQTVAPGFDMNGVTGGGYVGCDYQFGAWVVGVEGDWSAINKSGQSQWTRGQTFFTPAGAIAATTPTTSLIYSEAQERWYATARARLGYAVDKWLFFVSGGAAWAKVDSSYFQLQGAGPFFQLSTERRAGWTVGGGAEYMLPYNWTIRSEYLYVQFRDFTTFANSQPFLATGTVSGYPTNLSTRFDNHILRFGLAYKFGLGGKAAPAVIK